MLDCVASPQISASPLLHVVHRCLDLVCVSDPDPCRAAFAFEGRDSEGNPKQLAAKNVFAGSVHIMEVVKGTKFDDGTARLEADTIADSFFDLYSRRPRIEWWVRVPNHNDIIAMVAKMADDAAEGKSSS